MITLIDMHIRDERTLEYVRKRCAGGKARITQDQVAQVMKCHRNTALAILRRLERAGLIRVYRESRRGGYWYEVP
jgi:Mn-dependent DtxR family transcriptional regulator